MSDMFDHQPYMDRFVAAGGTLGQIQALRDRLTTAIDFAHIVGEGELWIEVGGTTPEAQAVMREWVRAYRDYVRS